MNSQERTLARLDGTPVDRLPVAPLFMIYAADEIGVKYSDYVRDDRLLVKAQLALAEKFPLDVVSCCSDAWREAADLGTELEFPDHQPPHGRRPLLETPKDLVRLRLPDPSSGGRMTDRIDAVRNFKEQVKDEIPILGWIEGPLAEAVDLYGMDNLMIATMDEEDFVLDLMDFIVEMERRFALAQIEAGATMIGIGDAAASLVSPGFYEEHVAPREKALVDSIHEAGARVRLHICGNVKGKFQAMASTGADMIDIDYPQALSDVREAVGPDIVLSGNVHPVEGVYKGTPDSVREAFAKCHEEAGERYILAAGCEIPPGTPEENVRAMFNYALSSS